jgi:hypothetical protein
MTEISDIYNAIVTRVTAVLPNHFRLSNVFDLDQNNEQFLQIGWGLAFGPAENTERSVSCQISVRRDVSVHITRRVMARELDAVTKGDTDRLLLEDLQLVIDDMERNFTLATGKFNCKYTADTGIFAVHTEKERYIAITANVSIEYFRPL